MDDQIEPEETEDDEEFAAMLADMAEGLHAVRLGDGGWLCARHSRGHRCGSDLLLPAVNSSRVGMWGYAG